ncbi:GNAT family N-acetyltransferase [Paenibacillus marinisediminis]
MLDKSIPFHRIILQRKAGTRIPEPQLPEGYTYCLFQSGDEYAWAEIETSVGEFENTDKALAYFQREYLPFLPELKRRTMFIVSPEQEKVATLTKWWAYSSERRDPWLHWVAVKPSYQGLGLGKAIVFEGMKRMLAIEGDRDIYLPTQTWSYKAIGIYLKAGFEFITEPDIGGYHNEYEKARPILDQVLI